MNQNELKLYYLKLRIWMNFIFYPSIILHYDEQLIFGYQYLHFYYSIQVSFHIFYTFEEIESHRHHCQNKILHSSLILAISKHLLDDGESLVYIIIIN